MASTFSIGKIFGVILVVLIVLIVAEPMIQVAFTPAGASNTPTPVNCMYMDNALIIPATGTNQYNNTVCLVAEIGGYNESAVNTKGSLLGNVYNITQKISFNTTTSNSVTTSTGSFFANILQFTGLSFVFSGIGTLIELMQNLGQIFNILFSSMFSFLPNMISISMQGVIKLVVLYIYVRIVVIGVSAWMKFDIWQS